MKNLRVKRNSSIELLRVICISMVIVQHICESSMLGGFTLLEQNGNRITLAVIYFLYSFSRIAVNVFILISGYFSVKNDYRLAGKVFNLLFMVSGYAGLTYLGRVAFNVATFEFKTFMSHLFPKNYYVALFVTLYIISPYINIMLRNLNKNQFKQLIIMLLLLFSVWSTFINVIIDGLNLNWIGCFTTFVDGTGRGFSIINFVVLYIIGAYLQTYSEDIKSNKSSFILVIIIAVFTTTIHLVVPKISNAVLNYDSIFIIIQSISFFCIFLKLRFFYSRVINFLAKRVFGIFLLHYSIIKVLASLVNMELWFKQGVISCILCTFIIVVMGIIIAGLVDWLIQTLISPLKTRWKGNKIYNTSLFKIGGSVKNE